MAEEQTGPGGPEKEEMHRGSGVGEHLVKEGASTVDAMGQDKRREVVGHSYGPSRRSQVMFFVAVGVILVVIIGGWTLAVAAFDQPPDSNPDEAPWSAADAPQIPTRSPSGPCGEPGNAYPPPNDSPCASDYSSVDEPPLPSTGEARAEQGAGGATGGGSESEPGGTPNKAGGGN
jgi:hypothetical protein